MACTPPRRCAGSIRCTIEPAPPVSGCQRPGLTPPAVLSALSPPTTASAQFKHHAPGWAQPAHSDRDQPVQGGFRYRCRGGVERVQAVGGLFARPGCRRGPPRAARPTQGHLPLVQGQLDHRAVRVHHQPPVDPHSPPSPHYEDPGIPTISRPRDRHPTQQTKPLPHQHTYSAPATTPFPDPGRRPDRGARRGTAHSDRP
jgi:hypothetical protein